MNKTKVLILIFSLFFNQFNSEIEKERHTKMALRKLLTCINVSMCEEEEIFRKAMPTHYLFKMQGFSQLSKNSIENYESNEFEAEGHKWRLSLYPNGNKAENGDGHISLYLVLVDTGSSLPALGELNVIFRLFLFDQIRDRYLIRGDTEGRTSRFREMKKVCGVPQFVSLAKFRDPSNGYLVDDTCLFGGEIFITKPTRNIECLSMVTPATIVTHTWRIEQFSTKIHNYLFGEKNITENYRKMRDCLFSEKFRAGNHNWTLKLYPPNTLVQLGRVSLYLKLADWKQNPGLKVNADFKLRLRDQISGKHIEYSRAKHWFNASSPSWGCNKFIQLGKAFLVKDTCIVEAEIKILEIRKERHRKMSLSKFFTCSNISMVEKETFREAAPTHYLFKIQAFSQHSRNSIEKYESNEFEVGGHKWKLSLYPNGNEAEYGGGGYISLYLVLVDTGSSLPASGELNVIFRLFLFDQIRDRYLIRGDTEGRTRRFNEMKVCGVPQFVSLAKFRDPSNGYLVDNTCLFGAEVFITKPTGNIECVSMVTQETIVTYTWRIENFSKKKEQYLLSEKFKAGNHSWNILIYPKGDGVGKNNSMSLFLNLEDCKENPTLKVYTDCKLRLKDQFFGKQHTEYSAKHWFTASFPCWGIPNFIGLGQLNDKKDFLVKDTCIIEAEVKVLGSCY